MQSMHDSNKHIRSPIMTKHSENVSEPQQQNTTKNNNIAFEKKKSINRVSQSGGSSEAVAIEKNSPTKQNPHDDKLTAKRSSSGRSFLPFPSSSCSNNNHNQSTASSPILPQFSSSYHSFRRTAAAPPLPVNYFYPYYYLVPPFPFPGTRHQQPPQANMPPFDNHNPMYHPSFDAVDTLLYSLASPKDTENNSNNTNNTFRHNNNDHHRRTTAIINTAVPTDEAEEEPYPSPVFQDHDYRPPTVSDDADFSIALANDQEDDNTLTSDASTPLRSNQAKPSSSSSKAAAERAAHAATAWSRRFQSNGGRDNQYPYFDPLTNHSCHSYNPYNQPHLFDDPYHHSYRPHPRSHISQTSLKHAARRTAHTESQYHYPPQNYPAFDWHSGNYKPYQPYNEEGYYYPPPLRSHNETMLHATPSLEEDDSYSPDTTIPAPPYTTPFVKRKAPPKVTPGSGTASSSSRRRTTNDETFVESGNSVVLGVWSPNANAHQEGYLDEQQDPVKIIRTSKLLVRKDASTKSIKDGTANAVERDASSLQDLDIVVGRGAPTNYHIGNEYFRQLVSEYRTVYFCAKRSDKPLIALKILDVLKERGSRFVKRQKGRVSDRSGTSLWVEVSKKLAYEKVCAALREGTPRVQEELLMSSKIGISSSQDSQDNEDGASYGHNPRGGIFPEMPRNNGNLEKENGHNG